MWYRQHNSGREDIQRPQTPKNSSLAKRQQLLWGKQKHEHLKWSFCNFEMRISPQWESSSPLICVTDISSFKWHLTKTIISVLIRWWSCVMWCSSCSHILANMWLWGKLPHVNIHLSLTCANVPLSAAHTESCLKPLWAAKSVLKRKKEPEERV